MGGIQSYHEDFFSEIEKGINEKIPIEKIIELIQRGRNSGQFNHVVITREGNNTCDLVSVRVMGRYETVISRAHLKIGFTDITDRYPWQLRSTGDGYIFSGDSVSDIYYANIAAQTPIAWLHSSD